MKKKDFINRELKNRYLLSDRSLLSDFNQHYFNTVLNHEHKGDKGWKMHIRKECQSTSIENYENIIDFSKEATGAGNFYS